MAKVSKSKKTKTKKKIVETKKETKKKEIAKKLTKPEKIVKEKPVSKKKTVKKEEKPVTEKKTVKKVLKEEPKKEKKVEKKVEKAKTEKTVQPEIKKPRRRLSKKRRKKIIRLFIITFVLTVLLVLLIIFNKNSYSKNTSFITKNSIILSSITDKFEAPIYSFAIDKKDKPIEVEGLEFLDTDITYKFYDIKRDVLEDDNVLITIPCEMETELEYVIEDDVENNWIYTYSYSPVIAFDYYSGDIYKEKTISDSKLVLLDQGNNTKDKKNKDKNKKEDQMVYTEQVYNDEKITVGVLNNSVKSNWGSNIYQGNKSDGKHFKVNNTSTMIIYIKAPKNYDGLALAINKNGATKETWEREYADYIKLADLQEEAKKTGEKSQELEELENPSIHKLLDEDDELRKEYDKDDFYVIRLADIFKDDYIVKEESSINLLNITGILVLSLSVLTCIFMIIGERNKAYRKLRSM